MQRRVSEFKGYTIEATDGNVGAISDCLFEDNDWKLRWFVINTGSWLSERKILIHPSALQQSDIKERAFPVTLTKAQVEASPGLASDQPVSRQMEQSLNTHYGLGSTWAGDLYGGSGLGLFADAPYNATGWQSQAVSDSGDQHLRSLTEVTGYHVHALDGNIGHLEDFLVDDETWKIEYLVIDTKSWGLGHHVLVSPAEVKAIDWGSRYVRIDLTRYKIKSSPSWQEPNWSDRG